MSKVVEWTSDYVKTRRQYGVPVGSFQAVQHKLADMHLRTEALTALSAFAAWSYENSPDQTELASRSAIAYASEWCPKVCESSVQLFGGIGFTWEFDLHLYLRRARTLSSFYAPKEADIEDIINLASV